MAESQEQEREDRGDVAHDGSHLNSVLRDIGDALRGLRFGQVIVVVQDGVVIQIDRIERIRLRRRRVESAARAAPHPLQEDSDV